MDDMGYVTDKCNGCLETNFRVPADKFTVVFDFENDSLRIIGYCPQCDTVYIKRTRTETIILSLIDIGVNVEVNV